jgi:hypothetical protein
MHNIREKLDTMHTIPEFQEYEKDIRNAVQNNKCYARFLITIDL